MFKLMFKNVKKRDQNIDLKKSVKMVTNQNHDKKSAKNIKIVSDVACQTSSAKSFHEKHFIEKNLKVSRRKSDRIKDIKASNLYIRRFKELTNVQRQRIVEALKGYDLYRRRDSIVAMTAGDIQKNMVSKKVRTRQEKEKVLGDSLRGIFSRKFIRSRTKSSANTFSSHLSTCLKEVKHLF